jgi:hypothetical protein
MEGREELAEPAAELGLVDAVPQRLAGQLSIADEADVAEDGDLEARYGRRQRRGELGEERSLHADALDHLVTPGEPEDPGAVDLVDDAVPAGVDRDDAIRLQRRHVLPQELDDIHRVRVSYSVWRGTA